MSARAKDGQGRWRSLTIGIRVSPEENAKINALAELSGLTKQDYVIQSVLNHRVIVVGSPRVHKVLRRYMSQLLVRWDDNCYCRCAKISFQNLMIRMRGVGWVELREDPKGFPGVCYRDERGYHACMYTVQQVYRSEQLEQAIRDMTDTDKVYYALACRDILGGM